MSKPSETDAPRFDVAQQPIKMTYIAMMPDGSTRTVLDGDIVFDSRKIPRIAAAQARRNREH